MTHPHLPKAPITEALIDLRAELPSGITIERLGEFQLLLGGSYPVKRNRYQWQVQFNPEASPVASGGAQQVGFLFFSDDSRRAVQARLDGFSFSWLKPYADWTALRDDGRRLWREFVRFAGPLRVTRVALRYINRSELPQPVVFHEYLNTFPKTGEGIAPSLSGLFMRLVAPDEAGTVVITEAIDEAGATDTVVPLILDIDVARTGDFVPEGNELWEVLEDLRNLKNQVFFGSVTPKALELFR
jgi:uncharacterized protein (TIGR04255 family)